MLALLTNNNGVIEDALWLPEIKAAHIGNKTDLSRPYAYTRLVCPWTLEPLEGIVHEETGDVEKSRGGIVTKLHPEGKPEENTFIAKLEDPVAKSLLCLHTWANYILWLAFCAGERNAPLMWEKLAATNAFKAFLLNEKYRPIPSRFLPSQQIPKALAGLQTKGILDSPSLLVLKKMRENGITLAASIRKSLASGQPCWLIENETIESNRRIPSAVYMTEENSEKIPGKFSLNPIYVLTPGFVEDPGGITHQRYIPLSGILGKNQNPEIREYIPEDVSTVIRRKKNADTEALEQRVKTMPFNRIFQMLESQQAWNPSGRIYDRKKKIAEDTWFPGKGNIHSKTWIIGLFPSGAEMETEPPTILVGPSGQELDAQLELAGLNPQEDVYIDNIFRTYHKAQSKPNASTKKEQLWAILALVSKYKPERILALGADAFKVMGGGSQSFTQNRNTWLDAQIKLPPEIAEKLEVDYEHAFKLAGIYHPAYCLKPENQHMLDTFREENRRLLCNEAVETKNYPKFQKNEIRTSQELMTFSTHIKNTCEKFEWTYRLAIDTESWTLDWTVDTIVSIQLAFRFIDKTGREINEPKGITTACIVFLEHADPVLRTLEEYNRTQKAVLEFDLGDMLPFSNPNEQKPQSYQTRKVKSTVIWDDASQKAANRFQEKHQCDLWIFDLRKHKRNIPQNDIFANALMQEICCGPHVRELVMTNTNHDRIKLEKKLGLDFGMIEFISDTVIGEHVINETNTERGLKASIKRRLGWPAYENELSRFSEKHNLEKLAKILPDPYPKSEWVMLPWSVVGPYAALDAVGSLLVRENQIVEIDEQVQEIQAGRKENNLSHAFNISCGALYGIHEMQEHGMPVGKKGMEKLEALEDFYGRHEASMVKEFQESIFELTGFKNANPKSHDELGLVLFGEKSPLTRLGLRPWKESGKNGRLWDEIPKEQQPSAKASTDSESLEILASSCPDVRIQKMLIRLAQIKTILTLRQSFIVTHEAAKEGKGVRGKINPKTLCMHTNYSPTLDTTRCRSEPNLSTFPNDEVPEVTKITGEAPPCAIRDVIQAPEGCFLLGRDWSTAEVLMLGFLSEDPNMLGTIAEMRNGQDFHARLALQAFPQIRELIHWMEKTKDPIQELIQKAILDPGNREAAIKLWHKHWEKGGGTMQEGDRHQFIKKAFPDLRQNAKPVTFGVPYGRTGGQICKQLNRDYFVNNVRTPDGNIATVSLEAAEAMVTGYKTEFSVAWEYLLNQAELAGTVGSLQDRWGYIRHFAKGMNPAERDRKAYNYQIQHGVAVLMNQAMAEWSRIRRREKLRSYSFYTLYDAIGWVIPENELQKVWDISIDVMTRKRPVAPDGKAANWFIPTEGKLSTGWASGKVKTSELGLIEHDEWNITGLGS